MRKRKYYKTDRRGPIICMLITAFIFMLSVGYAALNEDLTISGEAHFRVEADIRITDVSLYTTTYSALEDYNSSFGKDSMKVGVTLPSKTSTVTYKVTVTNYGNVAMQLKSITKEIENNNYNITFNKTLPLTVGKLSEEEIEITFKNSTNESQTINANLLFTFAKEEAVMARGNANAATSTFYNGPLTKDSIESITFMPTKEIPEDAVGYWDASAVQGTNKVMAYYLNSETEGMYDLYIAADGEVYAPVDSNRLFMYFSAVKTINFNNSFNTKKVKNTYQMFQGCSKLKELDLRGFDMSNVTDFSFGSYGMFYSCSSLLQINLEGFNTSKANNLAGMFANCGSLIELDLSSFDTGNVTNMSSMFQNCSKLININFGNSFKTNNVTNMYNMFYNCRLLKNIDLSSFNTENVKNMSGMFQACAALKTLDVSNFDIKSVESMNYMLSYMSALKELDIRNMDFENKTITTTNMFAGVPSRINIYVLNDYNKTFIEGLNSNANVIIYVSPEEEVEEG